MTAKKIDLLSIGEMERAFDVTQRTLRFYEHKGLLNPRRLGNRRYYSSSCQERLKLILFGKRCGLPLDDIKQFLEIKDAETVEQTQVEKIYQLFLSHLTKQKSQLAQLVECIDETQGHLEKIHVLKAGSVISGNIMDGARLAGHKRVLLD
ncbi:MAG: MerR family transcriptional regulator [Devosiaceae bacterium]